MSLLAGVALVVACLTRGHAARALSCAPLAGLGLISYGVYLWSVPVSEFLSGELGDQGILNGPALQMACMALIGGIAYASWRWAEMPLRQAPALRRRPWATAGVGMAAMAAIGLLFYALPARGPADAGRSTGQAAAADGGPRMDLPSCNGLAQDSRFESRPQRLGCLLYEPDGSPAATVVITGNSVAQSLEPGLAELARERRWRLWASTLPSCPLGDLLPSSEHGAAQGYHIWECQQLAGSTTRLIRSGQVDVVVALDMIGVAELLRQLGDGRSAGAAYTQGAYRDLLLSWTQHAQVILVQDFPSLDPGAAADLRSNPADDVDSRMWALRSDMRGESNAVMAGAASGGPGVHLASIDEAVCPGGQPCPMAIAGKAMRVDQVHFTEHGASMVADSLEMLIRYCIAEHLRR